CSALPELAAMGCSVALGASFHRYTRRWRFRCLVALPPHRDLLLCAKHLFIAATCQLAPDLRERHHTCLASRISMASTYGSLRQRLALRTASRPFGAAVGRDALGRACASWGLRFRTEMPAKSSFQ